MKNPYEGLRNYSFKCPRCGAPGAQEAVVISDVNMPFRSMVGFMVKWAVASIPAITILFLFGLCAVAVLALLAIGSRLSP